MRRAARVDANHVAVVDALRAVGCRVLSLAAVGKGVADLLILDRNGALRMFEVKDGAKPPSGRRLTPDQQRFHRAWPVEIVNSPREAVEKASYFQRC